MEEKESVQTASIKFYDHRQRVRRFRTCRVYLLRPSDVNVRSNYSIISKILILQFISLLRHTRGYAYTYAYVNTYSSIYTR